MKRAFITAVCVSLIGLAVPPLVGAVPGKKIRGSSSQGDYAVATVGGSYRSPKFLYVRAVGKPRQQTSLSYAITCSRGFNAGSRSGQTSGVDPVLRVKVPFGKRAERCFYGASAQIQGEGQGVTVQIWGKRR